MISAPQGVGYPKKSAQISNGGHMAGFICSPAFGYELLMRLRPQMLTKIVCVAEAASSDLSLSDKNYRP